MLRPSCSDLLAGRAAARAWEGWVPTRVGTRASRSQSGSANLYDQGLHILKQAKLKKGMITKSSIMLGLGEKDEVIKEALADLRAIGVDILTLGQYLQPTPLHLTLKEYVCPEKFAFWKDYGESIGFKYVTCGPLVRSSYRAGEFFVENLVRANATQQAFSSSSTPWKVVDRLLC